MAQKRKVMSLMFSKKLTFDRFHYQIHRVNNALNLISWIDHWKKIETSFSFSNLPQHVIPLGFEPRTPTLKV